MAVLGAIAQFERERIAERVRAGLGASESAGQASGPASRESRSCRNAGALRSWGRCGLGSVESTAARWITDGRGPSGQTLSIPT